MTAAPLRAVPPPADAPSPQAACRDAERGLLGAVIASSPDAAAELDLLTEEDFVDPRHAVLFAAATARRRRGVPIDAVLVLAELRNTGHGGWWGDPAGLGVFVHSVLQAACPGPNAPFYGQLLREATARRRVQAAAARLAQAAGSSSSETLRHVVADEFAAAVAALGRVGDAA